MKLQVCEYDETVPGWPVISYEGEVLFVVTDSWPNVNYEAITNHIVHCVNNHERLVEALRDLMAVEFAEDCQECAIGQTDEWNKARSLLATLEAEKGGE